MRSVSTVLNGEQDCNSRLILSELLLLSNAVKFTAMGRVELLVMPIATPILQSLEIQLTISDTGVGIPTHCCDRFFQPFSPTFQPI